MTNATTQVTYLWSAAPSVTSEAPFSTSFVIPLSPSLKVKSLFFFFIYFGAVTTVGQLLSQMSKRPFSKGFSYSFNNKLFYFIKHATIIEKLC